MESKLPRSRRESVHEVLLVILLIITYTYFFPRWADPSQTSRLDMIVAVVQDHTVQIDQYVSNTVDYATYNGHYYSDKAPGPSFLSIPIYAGLKVALDQPFINRLLVQRLSSNQAFQSTLRATGSGVSEQKVRFALAQVVLTFVLDVLPSVFLALLMFRFLRRFTERAGIRLAVVLGYALLTPAFAYANAFYSHQLVAFLLFWAFYLVNTRQEKLTAPLLLWVGMLLGFSVISEYPTFLIAGIIFLYTLYLLYKRGQLFKAAWLLPTGLLNAAALATYNTYVFGSPTHLGYDSSTLWTAEHQTGFMSLTYPHPDAMWGITFGVFRGLFVLSPLLLLALPGFVLWWRSNERRAELWVTFASVLAFFLFNSSSIMWWGGFSIGPRYLLPMLPFLALPLVFVFRQWGSLIWFKILAGLLYAWSLAAIWGLSLAEQAFPPDTIANPFVQYALPNWQIGNIARNLGTLLGLKGAAGLLPLAAVVVIIFAAWLVINDVNWHLSPVPGGVRNPKGLKDL